ncbi:MAG: hypothetical protein LCH73_02915 [Proteobacteria bacterium]|nr:hypothetical protein [Pseudomonadota bacterium]
MSKTIWLTALMRINCGNNEFLNPGDAPRAFDERDASDLVAMGAAVEAAAPPPEPPPAPPVPEAKPEPTSEPAPKPVPPPKPAAPPPTISRPRR